MGKNEKVQVVRPLRTEKDAVVLQARKITSEYKILPYAKVDKILDGKVSDFSLSKKAKS